MGGVIISGRVAGRWGEDGGGALHQHGHLVGDQIQVGGGGGEHGQARAGIDGHDHEGALLHDDDGLGDAAVVEDAGRAGGQADEARGDRGELLEVLGRGAAGGGQRDAVGGHHEHVPDLGHALGQVGDELGGVRRLGARIHELPGHSPSADGSASRSSCAVARARREPCWKLASLRWPARADSGEGAGGGSRSAGAAASLARAMRRSWPVRSRRGSVGTGRSRRWAAGRSARGSRPGRGPARARPGSARRHRGRPRQASRGGRRPRHRPRRRTARRGAGAPSGAGRPPRPRHRYLAR